MIGGVFGVVKGGFSGIRRWTQDGGIPAYAGMTGGGDGNGGTQRRKDAMKSRRGMTGRSGNDKGEQEGGGDLDLCESMAFRAMLCVVSNDGAVDDPNAVQTFSLGAERNPCEWPTCKRLRLPTAPGEALLPDSTSWTPCVLSPCSWASSYTRRYFSYPVSGQRSTRTMSMTQLRRIPISTSSSSPRSTDFGCRCSS